MKNAAISLLLLACLAVLAEDEVMGKVYLKSDPAGAEIILGLRDGHAIFRKDTGKKTPALVEMPVGTQGSGHAQTVIFSLEGYDEAMIAVDVFPGGAIVKPATAILTKSGRPVDIMFAEDGWAVSVDGKAAWDALGEPATTPCTVNLSIGKHEISLAKDGFKAISWKGDVTDKTGSIDVKGKIVGKEKSSNSENTDIDVHNLIGSYNSNSNKGQIKISESNRKYALTASGTLGKFAFTTSYFVVCNNMIGFIMNTGAKDIVVIEKTPTNVIYKQYYGAGQGLTKLTKDQLNILGNPNETIILEPK